MTSRSEVVTKERISYSIPKNSTKQNIEYIIEALECNHILDKKLESLICLLNEKLDKCRLQLENIKNNNKNNCKRIKLSTIPYRGLSPYFKYKLKDLPPDNEYTIIMRNINMLDFYSCNFTRWTVKDKVDFLSTIKTVSRNMKYDSIISLYATGDMSKIDEKTSKAICRLDDHELAELALPINEDYDWYSVAKILKFRHTPQEYSAMWKLYLHPSINKKEWNREECVTLQKLVLEHKEKDWEIVAEKLNTSRSAYQCFIYYVTNIEKSSYKKWTDEEDQHLIQLVSRFKTGQIPWGKIACLMPDKTKIQIYNRWKQSLQPNLKKGKFLPEEDSVLLTCVERFGLDFEKISKYMNGRLKSQLKTRYDALKNSRSAEWTVDEDKLLIQVLASQGNKIQYSKVVGYFPGKSRTNLRMRYKTLLKWMQSHPNLDLSLAPRRPPRLLKHGVPCTTIDSALDGLNKKLTCMVNIMDEDTDNMGRRLKGDVMIEQIVIELENQQTKLFYPLSKNIPTVLRQNNFSFEHKRELFLNFWNSLNCEKKETTNKLKTYSNKTDGLKNKKIEAKELSYFPPTYQTLSASQYYLNNFLPNDPTDFDTIQSMCNRNEKFKKEWKNLTNVFTSLFTMPFVLREVDLQESSKPLSKS